MLGAMPYMNPSLNPMMGGMAPAGMTDPMAMFGNGMPRSGGSAVILELCLLYYYSPAPVHWLTVFMPAATYVRHDGSADDHAAAADDHAAAAAAATAATDGGFSLPPSLPPSLSLLSLPLFSGR